MNNVVPPRGPSAYQPNRTLSTPSHGHPSPSGPHSSHGRSPSYPSRATPNPPIQPRNAMALPPSGPRRMSSALSPNGSTPPASSPNPPTTSAIPTGPRAGNFPYRTSLPPPHPHHHHHPPPPRAPSGPGTTIPGGRLYPAVDKASEDRLARLKAEQVKLEEENRVIQERKRKGLYGWEKSTREAEREGYKVELAESQLVGGVLMD